MIKNQMFLLSLLCILLLSGCKNPFIDNILGKANKDEEDFGSGAVIETHNVYSTSDWTTVMLGITAGSPGNYKNYVVNIMEDIIISPFTSNIYIKVSIRGNHAIKETGPFTLALNQAMILRAPLKGNNSNQIIDVYGELVLRDGGSITENNDSLGFAGVQVRSSGVFTMYGGTISAIRSAMDGGGVYVNGGTFTMYGGTISGNTAFDSGGGVMVWNLGRFFMYGGTIEGNTVTLSTGGGGGVFVASGAAFIKTGGIIYGNDAGANSNHAGGSGHAAYYVTGPDIRDYTLKPRVSGFIRWQ
jgi:hypothetical protein